MIPAPYDIEHQYSSLRPEVLAEFALTKNVFIETGSNVGRGIRVALEVGFKEVHSIESLPMFYKHCVEVFEKDARVHLYLGDSPEQLAIVLSYMRERAVIYLDAHSIARNPLLDELRVIDACGATNHTILIDDVRMFDTPDWHFLKRTDAIDLLHQINPDYRISYRNTNHALSDLLVAEV